MMEKFIDLCEEEMLIVDGGGVVGDAISYGSATVGAYSMYSACAAGIAAATVATPAIVGAGLVVGAVGFGVIGLWSAVTGIIKVTQGLGLK